MRLAHAVAATALFVLASACASEESVEKGGATETTSIVPFAAADEHASTIGTVNWFNDAKGFGFIHADDTGEDIYVHRTGVETPGGISEGQRVWFDIVQGQKGPSAESVTLVSD